MIDIFCQDLHEVSPVQGIKTRSSPAAFHDIHFSLLPVSLVQHMIYSRGADVSSSEGTLGTGGIADLSSPSLTT